jgi:hypothetical protein
VRRRSTVREHSNVATVAKPTPDRLWIPVNTSRGRGAFFVENLRNPRHRFAITKELKNSAYNFCLLGS